MSKRYESCGYAVEVYPGWKECGKPVKVGAGAVRCAEHAARLPYWPKDEAVGTAHLGAQAPEALRSMFAARLDAVAVELTGKTWGALPDDGAQQDFVMGVFEQGGS
jgi:hypothetical protein